jgi:hypothetical protein
MDNVSAPADPPSVASIVIKQTVRVTLYVAIASALIFAIVLTPMMLLTSANPEESGFVRWLGAIFSFALQGFIIGAVFGLVSGLISGFFRAFKGRRPASPPPAPVEKGPPSAPPAKS